MSTEKRPSQPAGASPGEGTSLLRALGLWDSVSLIMGIMVGSGIFLMAGSIALEIDSVGHVLAVWAFGGVLSLSGAVALSELGAALPRAGGLYVYLVRAYGRGVGFTYGWSVMALIHAGGLATLAAAIGLHVGPILGLSAAGQKLLQLGCLASFVVVNCLGVSVGKWVQNALTIAKVGGLVAMTTFLYLAGSTSTFTAHMNAATGTVSLAALGAALVAVLWAFDGWHFVSFAAGEVKSPSRNLPRALVIGTVLTLGLYILVNLAYYLVLPPDQIRGTHRVAAAAVEHAYGSGAALLISLLISVAILGAMNGIMLGASRVVFAMAQDGLFFRSFARLSPRFRTPVVAIVAQGAFAAAFTLVGTFQQLFTSYVFTSWIFYGLAVGGVIVLRHREPELERPYRCPWYPVTPAFFLVATAGIVISSLVAQLWQALLGIGLILLGLPLYLLFRTVDSR